MRPRRGLDRRYAARLALRSLRARLALIAFRTLWPGSTGISLLALDFSTLQQLRQLRVHIRLRCRRNAATDYVAGQRDDEAAQEVGEANHAADDERLAQLGPLLRGFFATY